MADCVACCIASDLSIAQDEGVGGTGTPVSKVLCQWVAPVQVNVHVCRTSESANVYSEQKTWRHQEDADGFWHQCCGVDSRLRRSAGKHTPGADAQVLVPLSSTAM
jgi:hypothetical protein